jgi:hypothetical protein
MLLDSITRVPEKPRPPEAVVALRKAEIARRYAVKREPIDRDKLICGKRRNDIEDTILGLYGGLPDTDESDLLLRFWAWHNFRSLRQVKDLVALAERLGAKLAQAEAEAVISYCNRHPENSRRAAWASSWDLLRTSVRPSASRPLRRSTSPAQRKCINKAKHAAKMRRWRGKKPRAQWLAENLLSRTKPWQAEGISRRTWERRRRAADQRDRERSRLKVKRPAHENAGRFEPIAP